MTLLMRWCVPDYAWHGATRDEIAVAFWERAFRSLGTDDGWWPA